MWEQQRIWLFCSLCTQVGEKAVFIEIGFFSQIYCKNQTLTLRLGFGHHLIELKLEGFFDSFRDTCSWKLKIKKHTWTLSWPPYTRTLSWPLIEKIPWTSPIKAAKRFCSVKFQLEIRKFRRFLHFEINVCSEVGFSWT